MTIEEQTLVVETKKTRGFFLSAWLIFFMIMNTISMLASLNAMSSPVRAASGTGMDPGFYQIYAFALTLLGLVGVLGSIAVWNWRRWGYWILVVTMFLGLLLKYRVDASLIPAWIGFFLVGVMGLLLIPKRQYLE